MVERRTETGTTKVPHVDLRDVLTQLDHWIIGQPELRHVKFTCSAVGVDATIALEITRGDKNSEPPKPSGAGAGAAGAPVGTGACARSDHEVQPEAPPRALDPPRESETPVQPEAETPDRPASDETWGLLALCLGFNELAKLGRNLGEKMYFRLLRDHAVQDAVKAGVNGGKSPFADEQAVIEIYVSNDVPWLRLFDRDVELMRAYVAEHDARQASPSSGEGKP